MSEELIIKKGNKNKGFASMTKERRVALAVKGGNSRKLKALNGLAPSYSEIGHLGGIVKKTEFKTRQK